MITQEELKQILDYNPETGVFTWKVSVSPRVKVGGVAGCLDNRGYIIIQINGKKYQLHRLAWLYIYGELPQGQIDHINGNTIDNRIENLRDVSNRQNCQNKQCHIEGKLVGTNYDKERKKWKAQIRINGKIKYLGLFETEQEAHERYLKELEKLNEN